MKLPKQKYMAEFKEQAVAQVASRRGIAGVPRQAGRVRHGMLDEQERRLLGNASTESFFNSLKNECVQGTRYATREEAKADIFEYTEAFYNRKRLHSALSYVSPQAYLQNWTSAQQGSEVEA
jgi:transposase InsO family protein